MLTRYEDLRFPYEAGGMETLWYIDDDPDLEANILRARRLERFLAQPFDGTELWIGTLGEYASLGDTLRGCRAILAGEYDALPEDMLS